MDVEAYLGEIRIFAFDYVPKDWAKCDGSILQKESYPALYTLLGNTFGGDGVKNFAIPDMRGKLAAMYNNIQQGTTIGSFNVILTKEDLPIHSHYLYAANAPATKRAVFPTQTSIAIPSKGVGDVGLLAPVSFTTITNGLVSLSPNSVEIAGGGIGHSNIMPTIALNYCIAINNALYPQRN